MQRIELPLQDVDITSLPAIANMVSVLMNYQEGKNWLLENHLNLVAYYLGAKHTEIDNRNFWIDFLTYDSFYVGRTWENCWLIRKKIHLREYIDGKWSSFSTFCVDSLERGYYIFVTINTSYIAEYGWHGRHQIFISGFDYEENRFLCSDFFGENAKYSRKWIAAKDIELAYCNLYEITQIDDFEGICLWKYSVPEFTYDAEYGIRTIELLDMKYVKSMLKKYLQGLSMKNDIGNDRVCYGINIFQILKRYLLESHDYHSIIPMQPIYIIKDHLIILKLLLEEFDINDMYKKEIKNLIVEWKFIIINLLKYNRYIENEKSTDKIVRDICVRLEQYVNHEKKFVQIVMNQIE